MDDIIKELNEVALELSWGSVDRIDGMPKNVVVVQRAIAELQKYKKALALASEVAARGDCVGREWKCNSKGCAICWQEFFLKQAESETD